jgi:polynucleotide 5'-hydroxyl-kinase GRC3/NOL9
MSERITGVFVVNGPARVRVVDGLVEVLGYEMSSGEFIVPLGRRIPVKAVEAEVEVTPSPDRLAPGDPKLYEMLSNTARELASLEPPILLVGPSDVGKSTLASMIAVIAGPSGKSSLLTVDVGQNELYAPCFAASVEVTPPFIPGWVKDSEPNRCFVGSFTPSRRLSSYLKCAAKLSWKARGFLVVDTDGWVTPWEGLYSKVALATAVRALTIVHVGLSEAVSKALESLLPGMKHVKLKRSLSPSKKTREARRAHRERLIIARLVNAKTRSVKIETTPVIGLPIGLGSPPSREIVESLGIDLRLVERIEVTSDGQTIVVSRRPLQGGVGVKVVKPGFERGLLAAAHGSNGLEYLTVIEKINYKTGLVNILTEYEGSISLLEVGEAKIELSQHIK